MKKVLCTRADDGILNMTDISHPIMKRKAEEWGADFVVLDQDMPEGWSKHYRILAMGKLLSDYDAAVQIDSDTLIMPDCPNPFKRFHGAGIAFVREDVGSRKADREERMGKANRFYFYGQPTVPWHCGYPNTGFFYVESDCVDLFYHHLGPWSKPPTNQCGREELASTPLWDQSGYDDVWLGWAMNDMGLPYRHAHWKWNHMTMFSEPWNGSPGRFDSYIIHYAGRGCFEKGVNDRIEQMRRDYGRVYA